MERKAALQDETIRMQDQILKEKDNSIAQLRGVQDAEQKKFEKLESLNSLYEKEIRRLKKWRTVAYILGGSTGILTILVALK